MKVIAFDFDGVIIDSSNEQYIISVMAFNRMGNMLRDTKKLKKDFLFLRNFAKVTEDFYAMMVMLSEGKIPEDDKKILQRRDRIVTTQRSRAVEFVRLFFESRKELMRKGFGYWLGLQEVNIKFIRMMKRLSAEHSLFIATAKDKETVYRVLRYSGVMIPRKKILSREDAYSKSEKLKIISGISGKDTKDMIFVEDNLENLKDTMGLGINPVLVEWGHSTPAQRREARKLGIPVLTKRNFEKQLLKITGE